MDDFGVFIMRKRCSIHLGKKDNCCSEQSPKRNWLFRSLGVTHQWQINGKSRKWQSIRNYSYNLKFSTKFHDLGVIIMRKRCSIQQGEKKITVDQSKVLKNRLFRSFWATRYIDKAFLSTIVSLDPGVVNGYLACLVQIYSLRCFSASGSRG